MAADELNAPLGQKKKRKQIALPAMAPQALAVVLGLTMVVAVAWTMFVDDPYGGEPIAVVTAKTLAQKNAAANSPAGPANQSRYDGPGASAGKTAAADDANSAAKAADASAPPPGSKTVTITDGSSGKSQEVVLPPSAGEQKAASIDPRLLETTRHGAVPKIAPDGARAASIYAHPVKAAPGKADAPRIAIIVGGLGISASTTAEAFSKLPAQITFAFAPYGADIDQLASRARAENHEVLLQAPMEPFDYPDNDPGPQTLLTSLTRDQNIDRLHWLMSRIQGYVGIANYMGARFTASEQALAPVLRETAKRGLIYVDDGSSPRSAASQIAGSNNLPFAKAEIVLDAVPTAIEIDRALARLEMLARERGIAVGIATAQPAAIARISEWAKKAASRGFVLVPISAAAVKSKSS